MTKVLFERLKQDYNSTKEQIKFFNGLDYMEAMIKFFGVLNISIVKTIDEDIYNKIFFDNFKVSPSLGDYKSLATNPFVKNNKTRLKNKDELYDILYDIFKKDDLELNLIMAEDILSHNLHNKKSIKNLWILFEEYTVNFRNKLKGHGASFSSDDEEFSKTILEHLDSIIKTIESKLNLLLKTKNLKFFYIENDTSNTEFITSDVAVQYKDKNYQLSPLLIYITCDKFSCKQNNKTKIFFYNDGKESKSYYLDYGLNHHFYFSSYNNINSTLKDMIDIQKEITKHNSSDKQKYDNLLKTFVGREYELKNSKEHIVKNIKTNTSSIITVRGKPGTGKSAFVSKLQDDIKDEDKELKSYIFYAKKGYMGSQEDKYFYNKLSGYFDNIGIKIKSLKNFNEATATEKLENLFNSVKEQLKEPLLLIIDGLDEFNKPISFLRDFPLGHISNYIHIIFTTRGYQNILDTLRDKLFTNDLNIDILNKEDYKKNDISLSLNALEKNEVEILINEVLTKDIQRDSAIYRNIQDEIYQKSQGLPIYIYYISEKFIDIIIDENDDIPKKILEYAKELPNGIDEFYYSTFKNLDTISSQILYIVYFSSKPISFDSFYYLIENLNNEHIDKKYFYNNFFLNIEIFLTKDKDERYSFYHLSVKEAVKNYFKYTKNLEDIVEIDYNTFSKHIPIAEYQVEQYKELFKKYYYLKDNSDLFNLIENFQKIMQDKKEDKNLQEFFKDNFLGIYAKYIWFKIYQDTISYDEIKAKDYRKFDNFELKSKSKKLIKNFFSIYEQSDKIDIDEIKLAYEFALLLEDYDKVLEYSDDYKNSFTNLFIDICWNLDKEENKRKFKELKPIWSEFFSDEFKKVLLCNEKILRFTNRSLEIAKSIKKHSIMETAEEIVYDKLKEIKYRRNNKDKLELSSILNELILNELINIEDDYIIQDILILLSQQNIDRQTILIILDKIKLIKDELIKFDTIKGIVQNINNKDLLKKILIIIDETDDKYKKIHSLIIVGQKENNYDLIKESLNILNTIHHNSTRKICLARIIKYCDTEILLEQLLYIINSIKYDYIKLEPLSLIIKQISVKGYQELLKKALEIAENLDEPNLISSNYYKDKDLRFLISINQIDDINLLTELVNFEHLISQLLLFKNNYIKIKLIISILMKTNYKKYLAEILNSIICINNNIERINLLNLLVDTTFLNNFLFIQNQNQNIKPDEALELTAIKDSDAVLRYYGIIEKEEVSLYENYITQLKELKLQRDKAELEDDEEAYNSINKEAETIKQEIKDNKELFKQFLEKMNIKKIRFNSSDILDKV